MDELGRLKARRKKQAGAVSRLEREVTALRNRGGPQASLEALEAVLWRSRVTLSQLSAWTDAAEPKPASCTHAGAVPVELSTGELAAWLCPDCDQQLPPEWPPHQQRYEEISRLPQVPEDPFRRGLLAAIALLYKRKAEILLRFDYGPEMHQQIRAIDAEIARRVEQLSEADRGYLTADGSTDSPPPL
jgi:hypothetical protein